MSSVTAVNKDPSLLDYLGVLRRRWPWVAVAVIIVGAVGWAFTASQSPSYEATAKVLLADSAAQRALDPSSQNPGFLTREMSNEISLAMSDGVEDRVLEALGTRPDMHISADSSADVLSFRARAATADDAALHANTWAMEYIAAKREDAVANIDRAAISLEERLRQLREDRQRIRAPLDTLQGRIDLSTDPGEVADLQQRYDRLEADLSYELQLLTEQAAAAVNGLSDLELQAEIAKAGEARVVQTAAPPTGSTNASLSRNLLLSLALGLLLGALLALAADARDTTIKSPEDIAAVTDLPVLASIPEAKRRNDSSPELAVLLQPERMVADAYQKVRSALEFIALSESVSSIMITSPGSAEGKTTTATNLAAALASVGKRTVLVDVDFRRPRVHTVLGIEQQPGLSELVLAEAEPELVARRIGDGTAGLWAIPTGRIPPNPASFVATSRFIGAAAWLTQEADAAVFDAPPLLAVSEAHSLAKHVDLVVVTARVGSTTRGELAEVIEQLDHAGANTAGVVLVGLTDAPGTRHDYYGSSPTSSEALPSPAPVSPSQKNVRVPGRSQPVPSSTRRRNPGEVPTLRPPRPPHYIDLAATSSELDDETKHGKVAVSGDLSLGHPADEAPAASEAKATSPESEPIRLGGSESPILVRQPVWADDPADHQRD